MNKKVADFRLKIVTMGDGGVGKTSIIRRYLGWGFRGEYLPTVGADFYSKEVEYELKEKDVLISWTVWDISGQPSFKEIRKSYYDGSHGAVVVYDISRKETAASVKNWVADFFKSTGTRHPFVLLGNKVDLRSTEKEEVPPSRGEKLAKELSDKWGIEVPYLETSAKTKKGLDEAFKILSKKILSRLGYS